MKRLIAFTFILVGSALAAVVALMPICPECGVSDNVVVAEEVSDELGLNVYVCLIHGKYYIRDGKYYSYVWHPEEDIPIIKADFVEREESRKKAVDEKITRMNANGWPDDTIKRVLAGQIRIGDTAGIVREAWGPPGEIHQEVTASGTAEIWIYTEATFSRRWVRFVDGKVRQYKNHTVRGE